jgi:hypothetical protein
MPPGPGDPERRFMLQKAGVLISQKAFSIPGVDTLSENLLLESIRPLGTE